MAVAARREVVRQLQGLGLSERQALKLMGMSPSTLRYRPCGDGNAGLRERLKELAGQHRRHGFRMPAQPAAYRRLDDEQPLGRLHLAEQALPRNDALLGKSEATQLAPLLGQALGTDGGQVVAHHRRPLVDQWAQQA